MDQRARTEGATERNDAAPTGRAAPLLTGATVPLRDLALDPGDELSAAVAPDLPDQAFVRAFAPVRAYQRLTAGGLEGLKAKIQKYPEAMAGRVIVRADDTSGKFVVVDGSWYVAALRHLSEHGAQHGAALHPRVVEMIAACPVVLVAPDTDPAVVLSLLSDPALHHTDPWMQGQRERLLRQLGVSGSHHSKEAVREALGGDLHAMRRYHAYRALQQMMLHRHVELRDALALYPLFHAAVGRQAVRTWLDWDDGLWAFLDDAALDQFHRLLSPHVAADGTVTPASIRTVDDIVHLCDVLGEPDALRMITEDGCSLQDAVAFLDDGAFRHWSGRKANAAEIDHLPAWPPAAVTANQLPPEP